MKNEIATIPEYTAYDYYNSSAPYEWLYQFKSDKFKLKQMTQKMKDKAGAVGVKCFISLFNSYCEMQAQRSGEMLANSTQFDGQDMELFSGEYICDETGVFVHDKFGYEQNICRHPIMPIQRLCNVDSGEERLKLAYKKGRVWRSIVVEKSVLASSGGILQLASNGIMVNSENAKQLSTYLLEMEQLNYDLIPEQKSVGRLGWISDNGFSPYVDDLVFDGETSFKHIFGAVKSSGSREAWVNVMRNLRSEKSPGRLFLAASFASVILEPCGLLPFFLHAWGGTETGKAQPLDTKIITPDGYKLMGDIKIGDFVIGGDGKPYKVSGVYPQGKMDIYKVTFSDGTFTKCCKEHLWNVSTVTRRNHGRGYVTMSLEEMLKKPLQTKKGDYQYRIPVCEPVEYTGHKELYIPPYALGALIGDGCLTLKKNPSNYSTNVYFSNTEEDIINRLNENFKGIGIELVKNQYTQCQYVFRGKGKALLIREIQKLGLNRKSDEKFIPKGYLTSSMEDRRQLLCGLMDTDGSVGNKKHKYSYSTKSERLAKDVQQLCWSLGYRATVAENNRKEFAVTIITDDKIFTSKKHAARNGSVVRNRKEDKKSLAIVSVELVSREDCQCIMVDSVEHTYLCDDFIVTHNTVGLMIAASVWACPKLGEYVTTFNSTLVGQEMTASFLNSLPMCIDELQIQSSSGVRDFDRIIYQLTEGVGRTRGAKTGGLQRMNTWRNCIITNGEHPISNSSSGGGAVNRVIEFECDEKVYSDLVGICAVISSNYGFAGREFVEFLQQDGMFEAVNAIQKEYYRELLKSDSTDKQAASASAILAADAIATELIFKDGNNLTVSDLEKIMTKKAEVNVNQRALEYVYELAERNPNRFKANEFGDYQGEVWGKKEDDCIYFIKSVFDREMANAGFNSTAFLAWAKRMGYIDTDKNKRTKKAWILGGSVNTVCVKKEKQPAEVTTIYDDELPI